MKVPPSDRLLWVAAAPPQRGLAQGLAAAGWALLHLEAGTGSAGWVAGLGHAAVVIELAGIRLATLQAVRRATPAPVIGVGKPADPAMQTLLHDLGIDALVEHPATLARVRACLEGARRRPQAARLEVDLDERRARWGASVVDLGPTDTVLLAELLRRPGHAVARETLHERLARRDSGRRERSVDVFISRLRRRLRELCEDRVEIRAVTGVGYRLTVRAP